MRSSAYIGQIMPDDFIMTNTPIHCYLQLSAGSATRVAEQWLKLHKETLTGTVTPCQNKAHQARLNAAGTAGRHSGEKVRIREGARAIYWRIGSIKHSKI